MHHPWSEPSAVPCLSGSLVPRFIDGFHRDHIRSPHVFNGPVNQLAGNTVPPELFRHVYSIYDADPPWFDYRGNGFPFTDPTDKKPSQRLAVLGDISYTGGPLKAVGQPP